MSLRIVQRRRARTDLLELVAWVAGENPPAALRLHESYDRTLDVLTEHPQLGRSYPSADPALHGMRVLPVQGFRKVLIFYRPTLDTVEIIRILHGSRDIPAVLGERLP